MHCVFQLLHESVHDKKKYSVFIEICWVLQYVLMVCFKATVLAHMSGNLEIQIFIKFPVYFQELGLIIIS